MAQHSGVPHGWLALLFLVAGFFLPGCAQYCETYDGYNCILGTTRFAPLKKPAYATRSRSLSGPWRASLQITSNSCPIVAKKLITTVNVKENNRRITLSIPGRATFAGLRSSNAFKASGRYSVPLSLCSANVSVSASGLTGNSASLDAKADVFCARRPYCSVSAKGTLSR